MNEEPELTFSETIKQPFPELKDIATDEEGFLEIEAYFLSVIIERYIEKLTRLEQYEIYKSAYDNGVIVEWKLKQTDPHAEIKAEYDAVEDKRFVKVFSYVLSFVTYDSDKHHRGEWFWEHQEKPDWTEGQKYELRYYEIDWNKLLSWSYANGEFVECEFSDEDSLYRTNISLLKGITESGKFMPNGGGICYYCKLTDSVKIKDEWLTEVKQCQPSQ